MEPENTGSLSIQIQSLSACEALIKTLLDNKKDIQHALKTYSRTQVESTRKTYLKILLPLNCLIVVLLLTLTIVKLIENLSEEDVFYSDYSLLGLCFVLAAAGFYINRNLTNKFTGLDKTNSTILKTHATTALTLSQQLNHEYIDKSYLTLTQSKLNECASRLKGHSTKDIAEKDIEIISIAAEQALYLLSHKEIQTETVEDKFNIHQRIAIVYKKIKSLKNELHWQHAKQAGLHLTALMIALVIPTAAPLALEYLPIQQSKILTYGVNGGSFLLSIFGVFLEFKFRKISLAPKPETEKNFLTEKKELYGDILVCFPRNKDRELVELILHELDNNYHFYVPADSPAQRKSNLNKVENAVKQIDIYAKAKISNITHFQPANPENAGEKTGLLVKSNMQQG